MVAPHPLRRAAIDEIEYRVSFGVRREHRLPPPPLRADSRQTFGRALWWWRPRAFVRKQPFVWS